MALAHTPSPIATASAPELSLGPSWLEVEAEVPAQVAPVASVHRLHPEPQGIESHPAFQHPAFYQPGFTHPSLQCPEISAPQPAVEQWATVLPFVRSDMARAVQQPMMVAEEAPPIDYRPVFMGAAFLASTLCVYASSAPSWVSDPVALASDSLLQRLAATAFQLFGAVTLTTVTGIAAVAFLLAGTQRLS